jgi:hypothetical protein
MLMCGFLLIHALEHKENQVNGFGITEKQGSLCKSVCDMLATWKEGINSLFTWFVISGLHHDVLCAPGLSIFPDSSSTPWEPSRCSMLSPCVSRTWGKTAGTCTVEPKLSRCFWLCFQLSQHWDQPPTDHCDLVSFKKCICIHLWYSVLQGPGRAGAYCTGTTGRTAGWTIPLAIATLFLILVKM